MNIMQDDRDTKQSARFFFTFMLHYENEWTEPIVQTNRILIDSLCAAMPTLDFVSFVWRKQNYFNLMSN